MESDEIPPAVFAALEAANATTGWPTGTLDAALALARLLHGDVQNHFGQTHDPVFDALYAVLDNEIQATLKEKTGKEKTSTKEKQATKEKEATKEKNEKQKENENEKVYSAFLVFLSSVAEGLSAFRAQRGEASVQHYRCSTEVRDACSALTARAASAAADSADDPTTTTVPMISPLVESTPQESGAIAPHSTPARGAVLTTGRRHHGPSERTLRAVARQAAEGRQAPFEDQQQGEEREDSAHFAQGRVSLFNDRQQEVDLQSQQDFPQLRSSEGQQQRAFSIQVDQSNARINDYDSDGDHDDRLSQNNPQPQEENSDWMLRQMQEMQIFMQQQATIIQKLQEDKEHEKAVAAGLIPAHSQQEAIAVSANLAKTKYLDEFGWIRQGMRHSMSVLPAPDEAIQLANDEWTAFAGVGLNSRTPSKPMSEIKKVIDPSSEETSRLLHAMGDIQMQAFEEAMELPNFLSAAETSGVQGKFLNEIKSHYKQAIVARKTAALLLLQKAVQQHADEIDAQIEELEQQGQIGAARPWQNQLHMMSTLSVQLGEAALAQSMLQIYYHSHMQFKLSLPKDHQRFIGLGSNNVQLDPTYLDTRKTYNEAARILQPPKREKSDKNSTNVSSKQVSNAGRQSGGSNSRTSNTTSSFNKRKNKREAETRRKRAQEKANTQKHKEENKTSDNKQNNNKTNKTNSNNNDSRPKGNASNSGK